MHKPLKRTDNLLIESIGDETLIYDEQCHRAYCLNQTAGAVWRHCDGTASIEEISRLISLELETAITEDVVSLAIEDLQRDNLLRPMTTTIVPMLSRRELTLKLGYSAAAMLPVIAAISAPRAAQAYSGCIDCQAVMDPVEDSTTVPVVRAADPLVDRVLDTSGYSELLHPPAP